MTDEFYIGPFECVDIAAGNAGITLSDYQIKRLAEALVDIGADFTLEVPNA